MVVVLGKVITVMLVKENRVNFDCDAGDGGGDDNEEIWIDDSGNGDDDNSSEWWKE